MESKHESTIRFYRSGDEYGIFSNFARYPVALDGKLWPTTEHYFQAQKFIGTEDEYAEQIRNAPSPGDAARMGRDRSHKLREDWEQVKDGIMLMAVKAKFIQHEDLRAALLATGDAILVEHTTNDSYWADGGDGSGKNMLGKILMQVRGELRDEKTDSEL